MVPTNELNQYGCQPFTWDDFKRPVEQSEDQNLGWFDSENTSDMMKFIMVKRGYCSNPTKVRNIQNLGGALALIADSYEEDMDTMVMSDYGGAGQSLTIPGFMIDYSSSHLIEDAVH